MSGTGKRGADTLNIIGVVTVGVCGAILTYVSVVALQAVYNTTAAEAEYEAAFEQEGSLRKIVKAGNLTNLDGTREGTISIDRAMAVIVEDAAKDPSNLVPKLGPSTSPSVEAWYGRPPTKTAAAPADGAAAPAAAPAAPAAAPAAPAAAPAAPAAAPGTPAAPVAPPAAPQGGNGP